MHSYGKSKSREGCFMTKYKWKIKLLKAQMKLQEEMLSNFECIISVSGTIWFDDSRIWTTEY